LPAPRGHSSCLLQKPGLDCDCDVRLGHHSRKIREIILAVHYCHASAPVFGARTPAQVPPRQLRPAPLRDNALGEPLPGQQTPSGKPSRLGARPGGLLLASNEGAFSTGAILLLMAIHAMIAIFSR
jgi:hypothetical protein